ncbi:MULTISPECIES: mechanosensitive ion channel family protein [Bradyrhizobium]|jgi:small-conductance mechanosensitive channel|uniref:Mechanosensitive ion channel protein MscS n=1 Tax=Bradyrhizobium ottawaense TaxID=931866 RepID=A0A2U8PG40_9BRAD|nr:MULTISPECIES: mechanosensitive ion channel domain-containing protein [Bradyrhizobium]AWL96706.1 mechanosensitive ion channel protein MscS [Bradyrhizobium ottawaense]MBR1290079.1 mechanosensitive ion channel [Bradyrhizobium ottawaense]MBR1366205.1 mechanosensitive ion channel [Bradyrhizobium ottawaense]MDA9419910.1 mechanosensitive ion channel protein MscS [Bradyrhizobium sp. CCBAU 25360]MDA9452263.1 mechanosensitive ion channel protein MscS [Bradyrhizobium sp. CCBAU 21360]
MNLQALMADIDRMFGWIPSWFVGLGLVVGAILLALFVYRLAVWLLARAFGTRLPLLSVFIDRTAGPAQLALCLAAVALVLPLAPLDDMIRTPLMRLFVVAVIALIGWISIRIVDMSAARYLQNFRDVSENFVARKHVTQVRVFKRVTDTIIVVITVSTALMTFDSVRQYGVSLFASAGAAGIIVGLAARPLLSNLIAGLQIAITQPIRIEDAVIIENEWGWVEDIASTYVVIRLWDWRRMVVPLSYFIEKPFQNWTRDTASLIGVIALHVDYRADVPRIRRWLEDAVKQSKLWDGAVVNLQVIDADSRTIELRALVSARNAPQSWDLRCEIREKLVAFIRDEMPEALPRERAILIPSTDDDADFLRPVTPEKMRARAHN